MPELKQSVYVAIKKRLAQRDAIIQKMEDLKMELEESKRELDKIKLKDIAKEFGVSPGTISQINTGAAYSRVQIIAR